jgi:lysophospholipase L1-like esterase
MDILDEPVPYPEEVETFDVDANRDKYRIVALGDSTTLCRRQDKGQRWPDLLQAECGPYCAVVNSGLGGTSSSLALFRWHRDVVPIKPDCVVISFLLNDSAIRFYECRTSYVVLCTQDRMDANLRALVDLTRSSGAAPVLWSPPPVPEWLWPDVHKSPTQLRIQLDLLRRYAETIVRTAEECDVPLVNLWETFPDLVEDYPGIYLDSPDGYHSNVHSQPIIATQIAQAIIPLIRN